MSQTFSLTTALADDADDILTDLMNRTMTLRSSWSGSVAPGTTVAGMLWADTTSATDGILSWYDGDAWVEVGTAVHTDIAFNTSAAPKQALYMRGENRTAHITPASAQVGRFYHFTTDGKSRIVTTDALLEVVMSGSNADYLRIHLDMGSHTNDATNPPTLATKGTTPTCRGWLFDAVNELKAFTVRVPQGFSGDASPKLRIVSVLNQAESAGDDLNWTADVVSSQPNNNEAVSATSTSYTGTTDIGANTADGSVHTTDITLTYNDATNPIAAGDFLTIELHRTDVTNLGGVIVVEVMLLVPLGIKITE